MDANVRVLVMERGLGLTHDLSYACRHVGVSVLGPVRDVAEAEAAVADVPVDVLVVDADETSASIVREAAAALGGVRVLAVSEELDPEVGASVIAAGAAGLMARSVDQRTVPALVDLVRVSRLEPNDGARLEALTRREREVLALLADGHTTQEVSDALSISVMTVQSHVKNVLAKLGVHSKVEAIRFAWRSGALTMPASA
jgi:DNA-binding NarL/FixJ family response regulator